ncbi:oxygen-dependent protoporphyrinogen oxidase [Motilibacter peucedani]|uniref:Coproporphyrinogen III oxidase n=1 Tax=Motilibacter peucedani TaxID=598650 RepID=A0A420XS86_9ACTN|nr:protoporphyrinogen oxidase [Motilibacter peucedani]RKS77671.1 oxygen-dependent protoporphyrinogen oxidase [Motilibacter peucedani]
MHVVVIGGGIAGLAAALELARSPEQPTVTLLEAGSRLGGALRVSDVGGVPVDEGAESLLARRTEAVELARSVGLGPSLVNPARTDAAVWTRGRPRRLPAGSVMGVPGSVRSVLGADALSVPERVRAAVGLVSGERYPVGDVAVGPYLRRRLGGGVVDRLVEPLLGGVYAGQVDELSLQATVPALAGSLSRRRTLLAATSRARRMAALRTGPVFTAPVGGVGRLPEAVAAELRRREVTIALDAPVTMLTGSRRGWQVVYGHPRGSQAVHADGVVVAVPAPAAAHLLCNDVPAASRELASVQYASVGIVTMAFDERDGAWAPPGSGLLVPAVEGRLVKAVTLSSRKWGWYAEAAPGRLLLRASVGRFRDDEALGLDDDALVKAVRDDLVDLVRIAAEPTDVRVTRWVDALPQYAVGHPQRVRRVRDAVAERPGLAVCGAAYDGVGIPAVIASAREAARAVLAGAGRATMEP